MPTTRNIYTAREITEELNLYFELAEEEANLELSEKFNREVNISVDVDPDDIW